MAKFDLAKYKSTIQTADVPLKKDEYIEVNDALKEVMGLPGIPIGHCSQVYGPSNGGKCLGLDDTYISTGNGVMTLRRAMSLEQNTIENKKVGYWLNDGLRSGKKITFSDGSTLMGTNIHKIKKLDKNLDFQWIKLDTLKVGDFIPNVTSKHTFNNPFNKNLAELMGFNFDSVAGIKEVPQCILESNPKAIAAFLRGLFSGDRSIDVPTTSGSIEWTTASEKLCTQVQFLLKGFGISCTKRSKFVKAYPDKTYYRLSITGGIPNHTKFKNIIGFSHPEKRERLELYCNRQKHICKDYIPYAANLITRDFKLSDKKLRSRADWKKLGNIFGRTANLSKQKWLQIRKEWFLAPDTVRAIDRMLDYNFVTVASIEDWTGEVGDPHIPEDNTYVANNLITHNTSLGFHFAAQAQKQGILPIFIITEGKISNERAKAFGIDPDKSIIENATYIEDIFRIANRYLKDQSDGTLPMDLLFVVDSIGNTISETSMKTAKDGTTQIGGALMKVSRVLREEMRVMSHRINDTRKVNSPKTATMIFINHSYKVPPQFPGGPTTDACYGGDGIYYSSTLVIKVKKTKYLKATRGDKEFTFGIVSKIAVEKNHVNGVSNSGDFIILPSSIIANESGALKAYKDEYRDTWGNTQITSDTGEILDD